MSETETKRAELAEQLKTLQQIHASTPVNYSEEIDCIIEQLEEIDSQATKLNDAESSKMTRHSNNLFPVKEWTFGTPDVAIISEWEVLLWDQSEIVADDIDDKDFALLFTGKSATDQRILGSSVEESYEDGIRRYFYVPITDADFQLWKDRQVSYRDLILASSEIFIVDKWTGTPKIRYAKVSPNELPKDYMPLEGSLCPLSYLETLATVVEQKT